MKFVSMACVLSVALLFAVPSVAKSLPGSQIELSMLVSGTVKIDPDGRVTSYTIDQAGKLPDGVTHVLAETVPHWAFEPIVVDGKRRPGMSQMYLRVIAKPISGDKYAVSIGAARFGKPGNSRGTWVSVKQRTLPNFPKEVRRALTGGTVFLLVRVGRNGTAEKVAVQQVNLNHLSTQHDMKRYRRALARASKSAARNWSFTLPTKGPRAAEDHWDVRVPITFTISKNGTHPPPTLPYGKWRPYVPGPRNSVAWYDSGQMPANNVDALPGGTLVAAGAGRKLLTPLGGR